MNQSPYLTGHRLLGLEGLALLTARGRGVPGSLERRVEEIQRILGSLDQPPHSEPREIGTVSTSDGYATWATTYDGDGNVTIEIEQAAVRPLLASLEGGHVLDAGCGTGRHVSYLCDRGLEVTGIDPSPAMLAVAREKAPQARFVEADLERIPFANGTFDAVVCSLVLSHAPALDASVLELARVLRPGGRMIISNPHPLATALLDWRATVDDGAGGRRVIPEVAHSHSAYVSAFTAAGLRIRSCLEPGLTGAQARAEAKDGLEEAFEEALTGFPVVIVWDLTRD